MVVRFAFNFFQIFSFLYYYYYYFLIVSFFMLLFFLFFNYIFYVVILSLCFILLLYFCMLSFNILFSVLFVCMLLSFLYLFLLVHCLMLHFMLFSGVNIVNFCCFIGVLQMKTHNLESQVIDCDKQQKWLFEHQRKKFWRSYSKRHNNNNCTNEYHTIVKCHACA